MAERRRSEGMSDPAALIPAYWTSCNGRHELVGPPGWAGPTIERDPDEHGFVWRVRHSHGWHKTRTMEEAVKLLSVGLRCEVKAP